MPRLVSQSAIGYYGDRGSEVLTEQSALHYGDDVPLPPADAIDGVLPLAALSASFT